MPLTHRQERIGQALCVLRDKLDQPSFSCAEISKRLDELGFEWFVEAIHHG
ncbi:hypothetical protein ACVJGD_002767 [Bradyrhizobium sp. USDA 10063]